MPRRLQRMVAQTRSMTIVVTRSEAEALLLEAARRWLVEVPVETMRPGDVLLFRMSPGAMVKHCAILSDAAGAEPRIIHAYWGRAVVESWMGTWWRRRLAAVFRWPGCED